MTNAELVSGRDVRYDEQESLGAERAGSEFELELIHSDGSGVLPARIATDDNQAHR